MHADFETPGVIEHWAHQHHHEFRICKPYKGENCLNGAPYDFLIVMGGPQSPLELEKDPYLKDEITLIQQAIREDKLILGFCLGAQLIGEAMGAKTEKSPEKEVGVYPVCLTEAGKRDPLFQGFSSEFPVIHWHNDMPGLTEHATILATSLGCPRQIIRYGTHIIGFQCHLEITKKGIETMMIACEGDLKPSLYTQSSSELVVQDYDSINQTMFQILETLVKREYRSHEQKVAV